MSLDTSTSSTEGVFLGREPDGAPMSQLTFEIYLDDRRYTVPTLKLVAATDEEDAFKIARLMLDESAHHVGAEVWQAGQRLVGFGTFADARTAGG